MALREQHAGTRPCTPSCPPAPEAARKPAEGLHYRDFFTVARIINRDAFTDNWFIHDSGVKLGRIQNLKNWSPEMAPDQNTTCLGLEYFCFEGDGLWTMTDRDLIELGKKELNAATVRYGRTTLWSNTCQKCAVSGTDRFATAIVQPAFNQ